MNALKEIIVEGLSFYIESFLKHLKNERGCADFTIEARKVSLNFFQRWAYSKGLFLITKITKENLSSFEHYLFNYKKTNSEGLTFLTQRSRISAVRSFFSWLFKENHVLYNPALEMEYPKKEKTLPRFILTEAEAKNILSQPNTKSIFGIRDRAMLEIFYSCGLRRGELLNLCVYDFDFSRQTLSIRKGKGQKDRIIPLGDRALFWLEEYLNKSRPIIKAKNETESLFLIKGGEPMKYQQPGIMVRLYMEKSGIEKKAGCHIFRHTMATHMLENGAGIRYVQQMLGHSQIATTQIYTRVAIGKLKEIHEKTFEFAYQKPDFVLEPVKAPKRKTVKQPMAAVKGQNINVLPFENSLEKSVKDYLDYLKIKNFSIKTILNKKSYLKRFSNWLKDEMIESFQEVTRETLQNYQKHTATILAEGKPLSHASRLYMIGEVALFFAYLSKHSRISINPAASLSMPKRIKSLPMDILSKDEIESIFAQPDLKTPAGLRDRAILELFYSTGMRLSELCHLKISDIDFEQNSVFIKGGKFKKDRYIPAGLRALFWVREYLEKARIHLVQSTDEGYLFLNRWGGHHSEGLNQQVKSYMKKAGIKKAGSTILFRHSMATHMMDNDADLRYIQSILGHESLETTKIYTHVAIGKLKEVHARTHPAEKNSRQADPLEEY